MYVCLSAVMVFCFPGEQQLPIILDSLSKVEGITSPRLGGLGSRQDNTFSQPTAQVPSTKTEKPWVAPSRRHGVNQQQTKSQTRNNETVYHHVRGILNKLTPERFDKLSLELLNVGIDSEKTLRGLIILIFEKAVDEPKYSSLYAQLCERLNTDAPNFDHQDTGKTSFYRLLLGKCQDEFENRSRLTADYYRVSTFTEDEKAKFATAKWKMLGNIRFIGELGKRRVVHEGILHKCIQQLLEKKRNLSLTDQVEDLECLCQIMKTVGKRLDCGKAVVWMDQYFERVKSMRETPELPARIRFMLQDVQELRGNGWEPRKVAKETGPLTIGEIRQQSGVPQQRPGASSMMYNNGTRDVDSNLVDIFGVPMAGKNIGIGPGVIQDNYRNSSPHRPPSRPGQQWTGRDRDDTRPTQRDSRSQLSTNAPPRLTGKNSPISGDKISLRPGASFNTSLKPSSPSMLPKSAQSPNGMQNGRASNRSPIFTKPAPVIIKQDTKKGKKQEKASKSDKSDKLKILELTELYWNEEDVNVDDLVSKMKSLNVVKSATSSVVVDIMKQSLNQLENSDLTKLVDLLSTMNYREVISTTAFTKAYSSLIDSLANLTSNKVRPQVADLTAQVVDASLISLEDVCKELDDGKEYPLMLLILTKLASLKGETWLHDEYTSQKLCLQNILPVEDRSSERVQKILEEHNLSFLLPMLAIQAKLWDQINTDPEPTSLFKWIKANVDVKFHTDEEFTKVLFTTILRYVTGKSSLADGIDPKAQLSKEIAEEEKALFTTYQNIMLRFLHESNKRQMAALYALQVFCYENKFPKGLLLRMYIELYDQEIIDDEAFLAWKEDINEDYPGKGTALFQVNQWLTWLEQAESESDEDEE